MVFRKLQQNFHNSLIFNRRFSNLGVAKVFLACLSGKTGIEAVSYSIQIVSTRGGRYQVIKTLDSNRTEQEIELLYQYARQELQQMEDISSLFVNRQDIGRTMASRTCHKFEKGQAPAHCSVLLK